MQCDHEDCSADAVARIGWPWSDDIPAVCEAHLGQARQLGVNLGRETELRVVPLDTAPKEAPEPTVAIANADVPLTALEPLIDAETSERITSVLKLQLEVSAKRTAVLTGELELERRKKKYLDQQLEQKPLLELELHVLKRREGVHTLELELEQKRSARLELELELERTRDVLAQRMTALAMLARRKPDDEAPPPRTAWEEESELADYDAPPVKMEPETVTAVPAGESEPDSDLEPSHRVE